MILFPIILQLKEKLSNLNDVFQQILVKDGQ